MIFQPKSTRAVLVSGLVAASLTLASCGGGGGDDPAPTTPPADEPVAPNPLDPIPNPTQPTTPVTPDPVTPDPTPVDPVTPVPVDPPAPEPTDPMGLIVSVTSGDVQGDYFLGSPPASVGSVVLDALSDVTDPIAVISGGSLELPVESDVPFSTIFVNADAAGYFQLLLPEATNAASAIVTYNTELTAATANQVSVAVQTPTGDVSSSQSLDLQTISVGTGEVQVSVIWDTPTDVDLWVTEPDGTRIYWANEVSDAGGMLDLDSNPACFLDNVNNENITYEGVTPPSGEYLVQVDYFSNCDVTAPTNFVVTIRANGLSETFTGVLLPGDADVEIARFIVQ